MTYSMASACRDSGDKYPTRVDCVIGNHFGDHLPDRQSFTVSALDIAGLKPIEATVRVICTLLLGKEKRKAVSVRQRRPACALIVSRRGLCASVQHHDKWELPRYRLAAGA